MQNIYPLYNTSTLSGSKLVASESQEALEVPVALLTAMVSVSLL